jgi:hypothetical protein
MLAANAASLVRELLPNGHREGNEWVHPSLSGTSRRSLSVRMAGTKQGVWSDFSSGDAGDALDLVAMVLYRGDKRDAIGWAKAWLGLADAAAPAAERRAPAAPPATAADADAEAEVLRGAARRLFLSAQPGLAGTPVAAYLAGRGIDLAELGRQPRSLRFHPSVLNRETDQYRPAMIAAVTDGAGDMAAVHRTWLQQDAHGRWIKAKLLNPKMSLGQLAGGTIRLWRGASGKPLKDAPANETAIVAEGIEDGLSCALLCPELRVLSAVSLANMARIELPPAVRTVILAADNDPADNLGAAKALQRAIDHLAGEGRTVRIARSPVGKDFNDFLMADATWQGNATRGGARS